MLIEFAVSNNSKDFFEKAGDFLLKPLRLSCGRIVKVDRKFEYAQEELVSRIHRFLIFNIFLLAFPVTLFSTLTGLVLSKCSNSYMEKHKWYSAIEYTKPKRRHPPVTGKCAFGPNGKFVSIYGKPEFIKKEDILGIHPIKYLSNPFDKTCKNVDSIGEQVEQAIGITKSGEHVILQQATRSCVPTCVAMLILDRGGKPNFDAVERIDLATNEQALDWIGEAGFKPKITRLNEENVAKQLFELLKENGSGKLGINDPKIGGHAIVLDAISLEDKNAQIRDPYHGWKITIRLDTLLKMNPDNFIQIEWSLLPSYVIKLQFIFRKILEEYRQFNRGPQSAGIS
ncbi:MAG: hypothetical protein K1000chlam3_01466 [Chlamydiae bacterium]|nr:hypothetical protein [Chlamydiota bacterium]